MPAVEQFRDTEGVRASGTVNAGTANAGAGFPAAGQFHADPDVTHYVCLGQVGGFSRGTVLGAASLPRDPDGLQRLLDLGAVRPASREEMGQQQVTLRDPRLPATSLEGSIRDSHMEIARLKQELFVARAELLESKNNPQAASAAAVVPVISPQLLAEKDKAYESLRMQFEQRGKDLDAAREEIVKLTTAAASGQEHSSQPSSGKKRP